MKKFAKTTVSSQKIEGEYERTLLAEIDGENEVIWLTKVSVDGNDREEMSMPIGFDDLKVLKMLIAKIS
jgi:hypothetical protein